MILFIITTATLRGTAWEISRILAFIAMGAFAITMLGYRIAYKKTKKKLPLIFFILAGIILAFLIINGIASISNNRNKELTKIYSNLFSKDLNIDVQLEKVGKQGNIIIYKCISQDSYTSNKYGLVFYIYYNEKTDDIIDVTDSLE